MTTTTSPMTRRRTAVVVLLLLSSGLGLTACGGSSSDTTNNAAAATTPKTGTTTTGATAEAREKLQACLKQEGVALPERPAGARQRSEGGGLPGAGRPDAPPSGEGTPRPPEGGRGDAPRGDAPQGDAPAPADGATDRKNPDGQSGSGRGGPMGNLSADERKKLQAALKKCGGDTAMRFGPGGQRGTPGNGGNGQNRPRGGTRPSLDDPAYRKRITAYVTCVRKNGFALPDPDFSGKGPVFDAKKVDQSDPKFVKASTACQSKLRP